MNLVLNIYTDESLTELKRVAEAEKLKIPYRVAMYIIASLENVDIKTDEDLIKFISGNVDKVDKIIKATFGVSESELDCIDAGELGSLCVELYKWGMDKVESIKGGKELKNVMATV